MSFAYPYILLLLLGVPVYVGLYLWARHDRQRKLSRFGRRESLARLMPLVSPYKPPLKLILQCLAYTMIVIALARPWGGVKSENTVKEGIEVVIAVDASNSMLAPSSTDDGAPDRMRMAKMMLEKLINRLNDDRVGLIEFAGDAYTLIPVTNDYVSAKMFLNSINPDQMPSQGTNIAAAIDMATRSFSDSKDVGKAIILLTDAEELENPDGVVQAVERAAKQNIQIDVIGVGGSEPVQIPEGRGYMIDPSTGAPVRTALNEDLAIRIAQMGKVSMSTLPTKVASTNSKSRWIKWPRQLWRVASPLCTMSFMLCSDGWLWYSYCLIYLWSTANSAGSTVSPSSKRRRNNPFRLWQIDSHINHW